MNPLNFFAELKRRNVYKVAIAYAVVAWLLVQTQVFPFLVRHALVCEQFVIRDRHRLPLDNETTDR